MRQGRSPQASWWGDMPQSKSPPTGLAFAKNARLHRWAFPSGSPTLKGGVISFLILGRLRIPNHPAPEFFNNPTDAARPASPFVQENPPIRPGLRPHSVGGLPLFFDKCPNCARPRISPQLPCSPEARPALSCAPRGKTIFPHRRKSNRRERRLSHGIGRWGEGENGETFRTGRERSLASNPSSSAGFGLLPGRVRPAGAGLRHRPAKAGHERQDNHGGLSLHGLMDGEENENNPILDKIV